MLFCLVAVVAAALPDAVAQVSQQPQGQGPTRSGFANPAEYDNYMAALNARDPAKRAQAMEVFIAWYPNSILRIDAHEQAIAAYQAANQPAKADALGQKLLQIDPDNLRALANRAYVGRLRAQSGDAAALTQAVAAAERGLAVLPRWPKPVLLDDAGFARVKEQMSAVFNGVLGFAALQAKDYDRARVLYGAAVAAEPSDLQNVYQLAVSQLEGQPVDPLGFWYGARAIAIAKASNNAAAVHDIDRYVRSRYRVYRGSEEGWDDIVKRLVAGEVRPPEDFAKSVPRQLTPPEVAVRLVEENDPAKLPYADWILVLRHRDASASNKAAAEKVWKAIGERQQGGTRMKVPMKVLSATPDRIEGAITDAAQNGNVVEIEVAMARPLSPLPAVGSTIAFLGALSDYRAQPFLFRLTRGELAPEFLPVAGGPCADPRPQMCTRDYRPACGTRRDGTRRTYGNACTACSDPEVVTQAAGACP
jgi:tetratricopeptide (TPR) repeat protein